jgi:hypothetical protein
MTLKISRPKGPPPPTELPDGVRSDVLTIWNHYPRIGEKIALLWGSAELQKYLNNLILDGRGDREGFPPHIASIILRLHKEHGIIVEENDKNAWNNVMIY